MAIVERNTHIQPRYKQTEVGVIPEEWEIKKVGEISEIGRGRVISHREISASFYSMYPVYSSQTSNDGIMGYIDTYDFEGEYVTWTTDGVNAGTVFYRNGRFNCTNVCGTIKVRKYNHFFVSKILGILAKRYVSTNLANPKLMNDVMKQILIPLPPTLAEQQAISTALSDVDALITSLDKLIAKKRDIKQATMQQLLTGKIRLPGFSRGLKPAYKQTEIGEIPEDWNVKNLGEIGECLIGLTYQPSNVKSDGLLVLRSSNIANNGLAFTDNVFVDVEVPDKLILRKNDILICVRNGSRNLIGKCALIDDRARGMTFGAFMSVFRTEYAHFVFYQFQSKLIERQIHENIGATINQITNKNLNSFQIPLPSLAEQLAIVNILSDLDAEIVALERKRDKTRELKQGMMQELLTGKTRLV